MGKVICTGRDGVARGFVFECMFDELDRVWQFFVYSDPRPASNEVFDMTFTPISETTLRQMSIFHHHEPAYMAKGIPDAMLPLVKQLLGKEIESSPPDGQADGVFRSHDAEKMWKRLADKDLAEYVPERRVYRLK